jgi:anti-anti-sigma factor
MRDDPFPVEWTGRLAVVAFPGQVDISNVGQLRDRLLAVINRGAAVLIADMTDTVSCDHAAVEAIARACQRAAINGTQVRLVVTAPVVRRVLSLEGLDRLVSIYPSLEAATAAGRPVGSASQAGPASPHTQASPQTNGRPQGVVPAAGSITPAVLWQLIDALGDGLALTAHDGRIALVNRRCAEMFGYRREELIGLPVDVLVPPDLQIPHRGYRAAYQQAPQARPMAERARLAGLRKDGATLPVEISLSPVPTASENFVLAVIRDATEPARRHDLADLARGTAAGQKQATSDLLDRVVHHLFQVGLSLQAAAGLPGEVARDRLAEALDQLDDVIHEIRDYAFTSGGDSGGAEGPAPLGTAPLGTAPSGTAPSGTAPSGTGPGWPVR